MRLGLFLLAAVVVSSACAKKTSPPEDPVDSAQGEPSTPASTTKLGSLDKSLIDDVITQNMGQIQYCYQRILVSNSSLAGKVVVKFVIAKDGSVSSAVIKEDGLSDTRVGDCVVGRIEKMEFPSPKNDGIVIVSYPFVFESGG